MEGKHSDSLLYLFTEFILCGWRVLLTLEVLHFRWLSGTYTRRMDVRAAKGRRVDG
jgi:hypothetical protein